MKYIIFFSIVVPLIVLSAAGYLYYDNKQSVDNQLSDVKTKIQDLPELEKDIFTKCMQDKQGTAQDIAFCQETTQENVHTLSQELQNLKTDLENRSFWEMIKL